MKYLAQEQIKNYQFLAPLPDVRIEPTQTGLNDLPGYIPNLFILIIGLSAVLAVAYMMWGGIEYITTDSWQGKDEGKKRIKNALIGLLLVIGAWFIVYNLIGDSNTPGVLSLNLNIESSTVNAPPVAEAGATGQYVNPCGSTGSTECLEEQRARKELNDAGIGINRNCTASQCYTQTRDFTPETKAALIDLKKSCNCDVTISGGTEEGFHSGTGGHTQGVSVDIRANANLNKYLGVTSPTPGQSYQVTINGKPATALYEVEGTTNRSTGTHWHIRFQ